MATYYVIVDVQDLYAAVLPALFPHVAYLQHSSECEALLSSSLSVADCLVSTHCAFHGLFSCAAYFSAKTVPAQYSVSLKLDLHFLQIFASLELDLRY